MTNLTPSQHTIARQMAALTAENGGEGLTTTQAARRLGIRETDITPEIIEAASIRFAESSTRQVA